MKFQVLISPLIVALILFLTSCQEKFIDEIVIYSNDFSTMDSRNIQSAVGFGEFSDELVLGFFNNESFTLKLNELPDHTAIRINIDLFIHDSWDGNSQGVGGPDVWKMLVDNELIVNTTFSNSPCSSTFCLRQSFPENGLRQFEPKTGAIITNLPGRCQFAGVTGWTTKYRITHLVPHQNRTLTITCLDELVQSNAINPKCDESWSVSKIHVSALNIR
jgi:hypothetical protein